MWCPGLANKQTYRAFCWAVRSDIALISPGQRWRRWRSLWTQTDISSLYVNRWFRSVSIFCLYDWRYCSDLHTDAMTPATPRKCLQTSFDPLLV